MKKNVSILPSLPHEEYTHALAEWSACSADYVDALTVAVANSNAVYDVLSDDMDFATAKDITLYTANNAAIDAARIARKLRR